MAPQVVSEFLTTKQTAERFNIPASTLRWWRTTGQGPEFNKVGRRRVLYNVRDVQRFIERGRCVPSVRAMLEGDHVAL